MKKGGWDCLRHHEILANGAIPFFIGSRELEKRPHVMHRFPRHLMLEAMSLPGVPSEESVQNALETGGELPAIDFSIFNVSRYCELRDRMVTAARTQLDTKALAGYVLRQAQLLAEVKHYKNPDKVGNLLFDFTPRVLLVSHDGFDYLGMFLYHGLATLLGVQLSFDPGLSLRDYGQARMSVLYKPHADGRFLDDMSPGGGFSYRGTLEDPPLYDGRCDAPETDDDFEGNSTRGPDMVLKSLLIRRLVDGYFNVVIVQGTYGNGCCDLGPCFPDAFVRLRQYILEHSNDIVVITIDGNDAHGCHADFRDQLPHVDLHFLREADPDPSGFGFDPKSPMIGLPGVPDCDGKCLEMAIKNMEVLKKAALKVRSPLGS
mmetsp:Transcript_46255/g.104459  ORF Transcript_46255/g.104459 Transcript_46255/m.104459 type:complete len:374 (+) Transcript_46255:194-1315(+)